MKITIFTDGASRGNPGRGGWGAVVVAHDTVTELGGKENPTTNNRMELQAVIGALSHVHALGHAENITIYTDSKYVLKGATEWLSGWEEKGWVTTAKKEVLNKDLWEKFSPLLRAKKIRWHLVSGHVGIPGNERTDKISTDFADGTNPKLYSGALEKYGINILDIKHDTEQKEKRSSSKARSKAAAYSYVSKVNGKINIDKTWAECEKRVKGVPGTLFKKALSPEEEKDIVADFLSRT